MGKLFGLSHLFMTVFLYCFANFIVVPAITDVTMTALCPGKDECSLAIYLTGAQQAECADNWIGIDDCDAIGWIFFGHLWEKSHANPPHDSFNLPFSTLTAMASQGSVQFLALAYVADNVPESKRSAVFGIMSGIASSSFVFGNFSARFLSTAATFQVAAAMGMISLVYMRVLLPESMMNKSMCSKDAETECLLEKAPTKKWQLFKTLPSVNDTLCLLRTSPTFAKVAIVAFFTNVADVGLTASLMYYLKAQFHFNKNQFADIMIISGVAGSISQVPYAATMISIVAIFAMPCLRSIASKQIGPNEQGKAQGYITGICSFANIVSPLAFSPLAALFLSNNAPFHFPGFSIMCSGLAAMIAFIQSIMIRAIPPVTTRATENSDTPEP
ncbi:Major facilitator superfamily protein [Forsythia ovata]|uniref:Major facilitator superfamily protein n=1 Tax=Forsythia ovata TaxID=205694 RepID=A0ABD1PW80_9LAMI